MRVFIRPLIITLFLSLVAPALTCAAAAASSPQTMDCCGAMNNACHKKQYQRNCCLHQTLVPARSAFIPASRIKAVPPALSTVAILPPAALAGLQQNSQARFPRNAEGHSPPSPAPLYILHSIFLI
ncbi:MAG: hypothetical protein ACRD2P_02485 [Terriglobia bacterium]